MNDRLDCSRPNAHHPRHSASHSVAGGSRAAGFSNLVATDSCKVSSAGTSSTRNVANARPNAIDTPIGIRNCAWTEVYASDSFSMSPYGAVICRLANPRTQIIALALEKDLRQGGIAVLMVTGRGRAALEDVIPNPPPDTDAEPVPRSRPGFAMIHRPRASATSRAVRYTARPTTPPESMFVPVKLPRPSQPHGPAVVGFTWTRARQQQWAAEGDDGRHAPAGGMPGSALPNFDQRLSTTQGVFYGGKLRHQPSLKRGIGGIAHSQPHHLQSVEPSRPFGKICVLRPDYRPISRALASIASSWAAPSPRSLT